MHKCTNVRIWVARDGHTGQQPAAKVGEIPSCRERMRVSTKLTVTFECEMQILTRYDEEEDKTTFLSSKH